MRIFVCFIICTLLLGCKPEKNYVLNIVHTNDLHSHLLPFDEYHDCALDSAECLGGFARIIAFMKAEQKQNPHTLFADAGDRFTGTAFYTLAKSRFLLPLFALMPYDVATLGNHEFDDNLEETIDFISQWQVPIVAANIKAAADEKLSVLIRPSVVLEKNGRKIGVIGVITPETNVIGGAQISILPIKEAVAAEVQKLTAQGVNIIVVISHIGLTADRKLAKAVPEIDVIIGGHSHSLFTNDRENPLRRAEYPFALNNGKTLVVSCGMGGQYVGKLKVIFNNRGEILQYSGDSQPMSSVVKNDEQAAELILQAAKELQNILDERIAVLPHAYGYTKNTNYCSEECAIGEYAAYLLAQEFPDIDGVAINSGAIRSALPEGEIKYKNLLEVYPYDSPAVFISMSGQELRQYLKHGIAHYHKRGKTNELLQTSGIRYQFTPDHKKMTNIFIKGKPLEMHKQYTILVPSFLATGGDQYPIKPYTESGLSMREILLKQLKKSGNASYKLQNNVQILQK